MKNNWTPDRPTRPGKYWLSLPKHIRAELDAMVGYKTQPCFVVSLDLDRIESLHINGALDSVRVQDWLAGAQWLPYVEPPDPFAEPSPFAESAEEQQRRAWEKWNSGAMDGGPAMTPTAALVEEAETVADGMSARIRDLVCIVENYDPEEEREDDRCPGCKSPLGAPDEPGMEPTPFCNACAHGVVEELALAVQQLRQTVRRAGAERDAQHAEVLRLTGELEALAKDLARIRAVSAIAGSVARWDSLLNDMHKQKAKVSELTATRDLLLTENAQLQQMLSRPDPVVHETPVDGVVPCCGQKLHDLKDGSRVNEGPLVNCDRMRLLSRVGELSSTNLLLTAKNARLQKEVATLELLRRGGK